MESIINYIVGVDLFAYLGAAVLLVNGLIAVFVLIPGEQPEKFLQSLLDILKKFSRK